MSGNVHRARQLGRPPADDRRLQRRPGHVLVCRDCYRMEALAEACPAWCEHCGRGDSCAHELVPEVVLTDSQLEVVQAWRSADFGVPQAAEALGMTARGCARALERIRRRLQRHARLTRVRS